MPLFWKYNQAQDLRWKAWGDATRNGVCFALSIQFIVCASKGTSFTAWLKPGEVGEPADGVSMLASASMPFYQTLANRLVAQNEVANTVMTRMAEQAKRVKDAGALLGAKAKYDYAVELVHTNTHLRARVVDKLNFDMLPQNRREPITAGWADALSQHAGLKYISIGGSLGGSDFQHGIAALVKPGFFGLFDPNFGLYKADSKAGFTDDLKDVFETRYGSRGLVVSDAQFSTFS